MSPPEVKNNLPPSRKLLVTPPSRSFLVRGSHGNYPKLSKQAQIASLMLIKIASFIEKDDIIEISYFLVGESIRNILKFLEIAGASLIFAKRKTYRARSAVLAPNSAHLRDRPFLCLWCSDGFLSCRQDTLTIFIF